MREGEWGRVGEMESQIIYTLAPLAKHSKHLIKLTSTCIGIIWSFLVYYSVLFIMNKNTYRLFLHAYNAQEIKLDFIKQNTRLF